VRFPLAALKNSQPHARPSTISAAGAAHRPDPKAAALHAQGMVAAKEGRMSEAEDLLRQATEADPKYSEAFNDLAVVQLRQRKYREAEKSLRAGLEADPKSAALQANLGDALNHQGRFADAIIPLEEAERLDPSLAQVHVQLGAAYVETGNLTAAQRELELARQQRGEKAGQDAILQMYLGELYARTGDFKQSIAAFNLYLTDAPDSANAPAVKALIVRMQSGLAKQDH
jgi:Flp pilus assembly protein TadD